MLVEREEDGAEVTLPGVGVHVMEIVGVRVDEKSFGDGRLSAEGTTEATPLILDAESR